MTADTEVRDDEEAPDAPPVVDGPDAPPDAEPDVDDLDEDEEFEDDDDLDDGDEDEDEEFEDDGHDDVIDLAAVARMKKPELIEFAAEHDIDLGGAKTVAEIRVALVAALDPDVDHAALEDGTTLLVRGEGGAEFKMDVPASGTVRREIFDEHVRKGWLEILEKA